LRDRLRNQTPGRKARDRARQQTPEWKAWDHTRRRTSKWKEKQRGLKLEALNHYGGPVCVEHGETDVAILELDHVNEDGAEHRKALGLGRRSGHHFYAKLKRLGWPTDPPLQVLCRPGNTAKRNRLRKKIKDSRTPADTPWPAATLMVVKCPARQGRAKSLRARGGEGEMVRPLAENSTAVDQAIVDATSDVLEGDNDMAAALDAAITAAFLKDGRTVTGEETADFRLAMIDRLELWLLEARGGSEPECCRPERKGTGYGHRD